MLNGMSCNCHSAGDVGVMVTSDGDADESLPSFSAVLADLSADGTGDQHLGDGVDVTDAGESVAHGSVDDDARCLFATTSDNDDNRHGSLFCNNDNDRRGGLFGAFADDDDDVANMSTGSAFCFCPEGFDTSVADTSAASDGGGFHFLFSGDANQSTASSDEENAFSLF